MDLAAHLANGGEGVNCPVSCQKERLLYFGPEVYIVLLKNTLFGLVWTICTFQTVLGRKMGEFH